MSQQDYSIHPSPQRTKNKVQGEIDPLQKQELIALRQAKLINNNAFKIYFVGGK